MRRTSRARRDAGRVHRRAEREALDDRAPGLPLPHLVPAAAPDPPERRRRPARGGGPAHDEQPVGVQRREREGVDVGRPALLEQRAVGQRHRRAGAGRRRPRRPSVAGTSDRRTCRTPSRASGPRPANRSPMVASSSWRSYGASVVPWTCSTYDQATPTASTAASTAPATRRRAPRRPSSCAAPAPASASGTGEAIASALASPHAHRVVEEHDGGGPEHPAVREHAPGAQAPRPPQPVRRAAGDGEQQERGQGRGVRRPRGSPAPARCRRPARGGSAPAGSRASPGRIPGRSRARRRTAPAGRPGSAARP